MSIIKSFNINGTDTSIGSQAVDIGLFAVDGLYSDNVQDSISELNDNVSFDSSAIRIYPKDINEIIQTEEYIKADIDFDDFLYGYISKDDGTYYHMIPHNFKNLYVENIDIESATGTFVDDVSAMTTYVSEVKSIVYQEENEEYKHVLVDADDHIIYKVNYDGSFEWTKGVPEVVQDYVDAKIKSNDYNSIHNLSNFIEDNDGCFSLSLTAKVGKYLGMNTLIDYPDHRNHIKDFVEKMSEMGVSIHRIIRRSGYSIDIYDTLLYYLTKYGIQSIICSPFYDDTIQESNIYDSSVYDTILEDMKQFITRYNGTNLIYPNDESTEGLYVTVDYYEVKNEYSFYSGSIQDYMYIQRTFYNNVKECSPNSLVIGCGFSNVFDDEESLYYYVDEYNKTIKDYSDVINYHIYPDRYTSSDAINDAISHKLMDTNNTLKGKECFMGEIGFATWKYVGNSTTQANYIIEYYITALSNGMTKVLAWTFERLGNFFISQGHGSCGLVEACTTASYGSFYKAGTSESASGFDWDLRLYINHPIVRNYFQLDLSRVSDDTLFYIKENGIDIGGISYTITKITLDGTSIYENDYVIGTDNNILHLDSSLFSTVASSSMLIVYTKDSYDVDDFVFETRPAYTALKLLYDEYLDENSSVPVVEIIDDILCASWINGKNERLRCIWSQSTENINVEFTGAFNASFYDCLGNELSDINPKIFTIKPDTIYYIKNSSENLKYKIIN